MEYVLIVLLLLSAVFIIAAVLMQKSDKEGLSGTISGRQETYYGKDRSSRLDRALVKWTAIAAIIFALAVFIVYVIQPDYSDAYSVGYWQYWSKYSSIF